MSRGDGDREGGCALADGIDCARLATVTTTGFAGGVCSLLAGASRCAGPSGDAPGRPPRAARGCDRRRSQDADGVACGVCATSRRWLT